MSAQQWDAPPEGGYPPQQPPAGPEGGQPQQWGQPQQPAWGGDVQQWKTVSQQRYGGGGGLEGMTAMLNTTILSLGAIAGGFLIWLGTVILVYADSPGSIKAGILVQSLGGFLLFGASFFMGSVVKGVDKVTKLGYMIIAFGGIAVASGYLTLLGNFLSLL